MYNVTGITSARPIWADVMEAAAQRLGTTRFRDPPAGLPSGEYSSPLPTVASRPRRDEWFVRGGELPPR